MKKYLVVFSPTSVVKYIGAIDDNVDDANSVKERYLEMLLQQ